jgi:tRNA nucleotidyltransferase/poly(A) polymerase
MKSFRLFFENSEESYDSIIAHIPMPKEVLVLSKIFKNNNRSLFAVGGAIRDYLYHKNHGNLTDYNPKDVDLSTEAQPKEIIQILNSPEAKAEGIKVFPKGEAFGVISAVINGKEFEIATFRTEWYDPDKGDGRRPDSVKFSTPSQDAKRRDLTINALFYDIDKNEIRDYNLDSEGNGVGLKDIKNLIARPVGNAKDRFREDKLRIPRLIRFFSRFNPGEIKAHLDNETLAAIEEFKDLLGVSPERISTEFLSGLGKALSVSNYLKNYYSLGINIFPDLKVNLNDLEKLNFTRNPEPILAWILRDNTPDRVRSRLNYLKYPNSISDRVEYLLKLFKLDHNKLISLLRQRDNYKQIPDEELKLQTGKDLMQDISDFAKIAGLEKELSHFKSYDPRAKSVDFMHLKGNEISQAMNQKEKEEYLKSLENHV